MSWSLARGTLTPEGMLALTTDALESLPPQQAHSALLCWMVSAGPEMAEQAAGLASRWLARARDPARAELLCAWAQALSGRERERAGELLREATGLAEGERAEPERVWRALGAARLAWGDRAGAHAAWTHPDNPFGFDGLDGMTALARAHRRAGDWAGLEGVLAHMGAGHDQARALEGVIADALAQGALGDALSALWWIPERLREGALLRAVWGLVQAGRLAEGWRVEAQWDGLEGAASSRALARILLGDREASRVRWPLMRRPGERGLGPGGGDADGLFRGVSFAALGEEAAAIACFEQLSGLQAQLRGVQLAMGLLREDPPWRVLAWMASRGQTPEERIGVARVVGGLEAAAGRRAQGWQRLGEASHQATLLDDFYAQRLALQAVAHAQIGAGDVAGGLATAARLSSRWLAEEHHLAAAVAWLRAGDHAAAERLIQDLPLLRRGVGGVAVLSALARERDKMLLAWDIFVT